MAKYVAFIDNVRKRRPVEITDKQILSRASASSIADFGHAWIIKGNVTEEQIKKMFNRPPKDVLVYDAYEEPYELNISTGIAVPEAIVNGPPSIVFSGDSIDGDNIPEGKQANG